MLAGNRCRFRLHETRVDAGRNSSIILWRFSGHARHCPARVLYLVLPYASSTCTQQSPPQAALQEVIENKSCLFEIHFFRSNYLETILHTTFIGECSCCVKHSAQGIGVLFEAVYPRFEIAFFRSRPSPPCFPSLLPVSQGTNHPLNLASR